MESKDTGRLGFGGIRKRWILSFIVVLIIPAAGCIVALLHTRTVVIREIVQASLRVNKSIQAAIDARFDSGNRIAGNIILDRRLREILLKNNTWQDIVIRQEELIKLLTYHTSANPGMDILIYVADLKYIFTANTANDISRLYRALVYLGHTDIGENEWARFLEAAGNVSGYVSSPLLSYNAFSRQALAYCVNTSQPLFSNCFPANIIVTMQYDDIAKMFEDRGDSAILILDNAGVPLYSFGMDLPDIQISLKESPRGYQIVRHLGNEYVCTFRKSEIGPFAYAVMTRQTSFWNWYNTVERITIIVMIAALVLGLAMSFSLLHINYRPVRSVMNTLDAGDFPAGTIRGNEFDIIREQVLSLTNARNKIEKDLLKQDRFLRETILNTALTRNKQFFSNDDLMESIGLDCAGRLLVPVSVLPINIEQSPLAYTIQSPYTEVTIAMMLDDTLEDLAGGKFDFYKTTVEQAAVFIFFIRKEDMALFYQDIQNAMEELCSLFHKKYSLLLDVVIGNEAPSLDMLFPRYQEIRTAHMIGVISGEHRVMRLQENHPPAGNGNMLTDEYVQLLSEAIEHRSRDNAWKITNDYFLQLGENNYPFHVFRFYVFSLVSMLIDILPPSVRETGSYALKDVLDSVISDGSQAQLRQSLQRFLGLFYLEAGEEDSERAGIFPRINNFIMRNYNDINLSLTMIADSVGLSVKYISKLFKIETGQGLLTYIGTIRIKKAKELLNGGRHNLNEIALMVGYSSVKTFRRVFQKLEGVNPSEYRSVTKPADIPLYGTGIVDIHCKVP